MPKFLTARQVADLLCLSPKRVYELAQRKEIPSVRVGFRQIRFIEEDLIAWAKAGGTPQQGLPHVFSKSPGHLAGTVRGART